MKRLAVLSFVVLACSDSQAPTVALTHPSLRITAGDQQTDTVGKTLPTSIVATLTDRDSGLPLPGQIVYWVPVNGSGSVFTPTVQTGADGVARQSWTLGPRAGQQQLVARWLDPDTGEPVTLDTARATAVPGVARDFVAEFGPNSNPQGVNVLTVGNKAYVVYSFEDAHGNKHAPCADGGSIDRIAWSTSDSAALHIGGPVTLPDGRRALEVTAIAARPVGVDVIGTPAAACAPGVLAKGVSFLIQD